MASHGKASLEELSSCEADLIDLFSEVVKTYDNTILEGHRVMERQKELFRTKKSKTLGSKHLSLPSRAVDVSPYPIPSKWGEGDFKVLAQFYHFAGYVKAVADRMGIIVRWGGDWDSDYVFNDQTFDDLVHWELINEEG